MRELVAPSLAIAILSVGCYVSATVTGGDPRFDASTPPGTSPTDAGADGEGCQPLADPSAPATFTSLYTNYLGPTPTAKMSCSFAKNGCHATILEPGGSATNFACSPMSKDECYASLSAAKNESNVPLVIAGDVDASYLPRVLRQVNEPLVPGVLRMPLSPTTAAMCPSDIDRVKAWIANGAKND